MKLVTMTRDMRPWQRGNDVLLPDAAAAQLVAEGASENPRDFPSRVVEPRKAPAPAKTFKTK